MKQLIFTISAREVGGTPSELGMIRYNRDVQRDGAVQPPMVSVKDAVTERKWINRFRTFQFDTY
ncbi:hypothetical protein [Paenibacillus harenae]|uniref:S-adenosylhomocysteine hydrolase n=1 Tax=Paenibacillus harenae TaxID=306543 RepID=A0ABT9TTG5_PAEHA|nr:hypothetical protein [Paenibacillus harenae]MDQ0061472.1 S-adenosylhomocysteine hydrolase [Paenibacillus harenae]MDQ0110632.1 S-adenosylhomocysteine hydrolase [Paenibacillus harenae]